MKETADQFRETIIARAREIKIQTGLSQDEAFRKARSEYKAERKKARISELQCEVPEAVGGLVGWAYNLMLPTEFT